MYLIPKSDAVMGRNNMDTNGTISIKLSRTSWHWRPSRLVFYKFLYSTIPTWWQWELPRCGQHCHQSMSDIEIWYDNVNFLWENYVGHCPLSEVYLIYTTFRELALLPSSGWLVGCHYTDTFFSIMTTNHLKTGVELTPETSCVKYRPSSDNGEFPTSC
jgi:hypothetical protein